MIKTLTRVGKSYGLIFDAALRERSLRKAPAPTEVKSAIRRTVKDYRKTLRKLA